MPSPRGLLGVSIGRRAAGLLSKLRSDSNDAINMPPAKARRVSSEASPPPPHATCRVDVANETDEVVDSARLAAAVQIVLADAECETATVSVAIVDDPTIHRLNRQFLEHDYPTDVLSFALAEPPRVEGEIIASVDTARREATEAGWTPGDELLLYAVHGALHLVGYLDKTSEDSAAMRNAERSVLARLGVTVSPGDARWQASGQASSGAEEDRS
jgi:probable rRNA maturation factor